MSEYCEPGHGGSNAGTLANPFTSTQYACDNRTDPDLRFTGSEVLSTYITNSTAGTETDQNFLTGCDASYNRVEGTYFELDSNSAVIYSLLSSAVYSVYEAFEVHHATVINMREGAGKGTFIDIKSYSSAAVGFRGSTGSIWFRCHSINNTSHAYQIDSGSSLDHCVAGGSANGFYMSGGSATNCIAYDCTIGAVFQANVNFVGGIIDNCGTGLQGALGTGYHEVQYTIFTNCTTAIDCTYDVTMGYNNAFWNNTAKTIGGTRYYVMGDNDADITLSASPYADASYATSRDYSIDWTNTDLVQLQVTWNENDTKSYVTTGLEPLAASGGGGGGNLIDGSLIQ